MTVVKSPSHQRPLNEEHGPRSRIVGSHGRGFVRDFGTPEVIWPRHHETGNGKRVYRYLWGKTSQKPTSGAFAGEKGISQQPCDHGESPLVKASPQFGGLSVGSHQFWIEQTSRESMVLLDHPSSDRLSQQDWQRVCGRDTWLVRRRRK